MEDSKNFEENKPAVPPPPPWKVKDRERMLDIKADPEDATKIPEKKSSESESKKLKRIGILSFAKAYAVMGLLMGVVMSTIYGTIFFVFGNYADTLNIDQGVDVGIIDSYGIIALVVIPIIYTVLGFVGGAIMAVAFNLVLRISGGIEVEFEE